MKNKENYNYFDEYISLADYIVKSANALKDVVENFNLDKLNSNMVEVHKFEHEADNIVHKMRNYLIKDFLPPIDREDVSLIINKLDNIEDGIDEVLINFKIFDINNIKPEVIELINILVESCVAVKEMFTNFKDIKNTEMIKDKVIQINKLEEQGDRIYEKLISTIYKEEKDPITLIKWTNIYNCLEDTMDCCEEISSCIEDVIIKNS
ncbi:MAG: DUF47 family protein [Bacilli bacterium]|nr:DUF47 family protein [Bacilli bacterium]